MATRVPVALTIAGSDSGGGAGIQADLKAFAAVGVHGTSAITALTAQSTVGVDAIHQVPGEIVVAQVRSVAADIGVDAIKIGMLGSEEAIDAVLAALDLVPGKPVVVDPVLVSESGAQLLEPAAKQALIARLLPRASVVTPNVPEARELTGLGDETGPEQLAAAVRALGPGAAIVTGGHTADGADVLDDGSGEPLRIAGELHPEGASHGSGCTHAATVAAELALGRDLRDAAVAARQAAGRAVAQALRELGAGAGPVDVLGTVRRL